MRGWRAELNVKLPSAMSQLSAVPGSHLPAPAKVGAFLCYVIKVKYFSFRGQLLFPFLGRAEL